MFPNSGLLLPIGSLLIAILSISSGAALAKGLFPVLGAEGTTAARFLVAAVIMVVMLRGWRARITRENSTNLAIYGIALCGMNLFFYIAMTTLPLGVTAAIQFMGPLAVSVTFSRNRMDFAWAGLAAVGLLLLMPLTDSPDALDPTGILWALASAVCWALYIVFGQKAGFQHGNQTAALGMAIAALIAFPVGIAEAGSAMLDLELWPLVILVALMSSAIPITLEMFALQRLPTRTFGVLMSIEPVIGTIVGFVLLHEALTIVQIVAIVLVVIACAAASLSARPKPPVAPQV